MTSSQSASQLADARRESTTETEVKSASPTLSELLPSPEVIAQIEETLSPTAKAKVEAACTGYEPKAKKTVYKDMFGNTGRRPYRKKRYSDDSLEAEEDRQEQSTGKRS